MIGAILALRQARAQFAYLNARDLDAFMKAMADDVVFEFPGQTLGSGRHVGREAVRAFFETMFEHHPEVRFTLRHVAVEHIFSMSGTNSLLIEWDLDYTDRDGRWFHNSGVTSGSSEGGKIVRLRDYILDWVALDEANELATGKPAQRVDSPPIGVGGTG